MLSKTIIIRSINLVIIFSLLYSGIITEIFIYNEHMGRKRKCLRESDGGAAGAASGGADGAPLSVLNPTSVNAGAGGAGGGAEGRGGAGGRGGAC